MKIIITPFLFLLLLFIGCNSTSSSDPKDVLSHFFEAISTKNIEEAKKYVTKDSEGMLNMVQMGMNNMEDSSEHNLFKKESLDMGDPIISGDRATITVKDKKSGEETAFVLKKENSAWKVAFDKSTLMEMAQKKMKEHGVNDLNDIDSNSIQLDSLQHHFNNLSPEEKEKAKKILDNASEILKSHQ